MLDAFLVPFLWVLGAGLGLVIVGTVGLASCLAFQVARAIILSGPDGEVADEEDGEG